MSSFKQFRNLSNPKDKHYILTLKNNDDPYKDPAVFEEKFKEITGLGSKDFNLETKMDHLLYKVLLILVGFEAHTILSK